VGHPAPRLRGRYAMRVRNFRGPWSMQRGVPARCQHRCQIRRAPLARDPRLAVVQLRRRPTTL